MERSAELGVFRGEEFVRDKVVSDRERDVRFG